MASSTKAVSGKTSIPDPPHYVALPALSNQSSSGSNTNKRDKRKALTEAKAVDEDKSEALKSLRQRKAWETALGPAKSIPMQGFMMYMSGSTIQIFSAMAVIMLVKNAIGGALNVNNVFQAFESPKSSAATANAAASSSSSTDATEGEPYALLPQKIAFVVCQGLLFCVALYKVHTMGLLPTHSSDWLAFVEPNTAVEWSTVSRSVAGTV